MQFDSATTCSELLKLTLEKLNLSGAKGFALYENVDGAGNCNDMTQEK